MNDILHTQNPAQRIDYQEFPSDITDFEMRENRNAEYWQRSCAFKLSAAQILISAIIFMAFMAGLGLFGLIEARGRGPSIVDANLSEQQAAPVPLDRRCDNDSPYADRIC
ncbi:hypothetical protein [Phyllobacterium myrsinacearum]|uniref:Putative membrane-bound mannosyltransferase n=1 Tax=Phyllobacterium myrsinacearum TaxID=28101 RepID=A0A839EJS4_9HYPH|nr:hypothetical protein [Phyllobacterium myrsinacearum]MBA8879049.1 putative membrane-bound mannosyltransferase [Phyllobacterium myrsinacearum]